YICRQAGFPSLDELSQTYYAPVSSVFPTAACKAVFKNATHDESEAPLYLEITTGKGKTLKVYPNTDRAERNKKKITLPGICIYNGKGFYLPATF
ncbi:MAG: hypothetical protein K2J57_01660, partial [Bacteroidales bacterium]|nr:hypothetical protein [Bacteroidales bacterium]